MAKQYNMMTSMIIITAIFNNTLALLFWCNSALNFA